jgi:hypothetical protein
MSVHNITRWRYKVFRLLRNMYWYAGWIACVSIRISHISTIWYVAPVIPTLICLIVDSLASGFEWNGLLITVLLLSMYLTTTVKLFWVPCCDVCYDFLIKRCSVCPYIQLFIGGLMCYCFIFVCLRIVVSNTYC